MMRRTRADGGRQANISIGQQPIVVAVGAEPQALDAAWLANTIAQVTGGDLTLVAVRSSSPAEAPRQIGETEAKVRARLKRLQALVAADARARIEPDHSVARGLSRVVAREGAGLLVLGSSRRAPEGRVSIGNYTRQLLADAPCPVAVAPRGLYSRGQQRLTTIGVGYADSADSAAALSWAQSLARMSGARLRVRAVADDRLPDVGWTPTSGPDLDEIWDTVVGPRVESLSEQAGRAVAGTDAIVEAEPGVPPEALVALSREVDLLVVGSGHWGPLPLETTGEELMRQAYCSVMVVA